MRTIKEIQAEIDSIYAEERKLSNKRNGLYKEIREVEKSELKDFTGKYIHCEDDTVETVMTVFKQDYLAYDGKIHIEGPRIIIEQKYKDTFICNTNKDRQIKLYGDYAKLEYDLEKFKNYTSGKYPKIEEITYEQYKEYVDKFTGEMKWLANAMAWIETSNTQI